MLEKLKKNPKGHMYEATRTKKWGCGFMITPVVIKRGENPGENKFGLILESIRNKALNGEDIAEGLKELENL